nr:VWA-like domain-containing protein [Cognatishimia sp. F0-27]
MSGGPAPVFEPGNARHRKRARIVVGLDSSGSVADPLLALFCAEVAGIARRTGAEVHLMCFDETVYAQSVVEPGRLATALTALDMRREGGTSFVDVMAQAGRLDPSIVVVLSDLDGPYGPPPAFDVLWATPVAAPPTPPFGRVLSLAR